MRQILSSLLLVALSASFQTAAAQERPRPYFVIILADDPGYGDPGAYNPQSRIATPNIDRLAREGMRFTDAHSAGALCHPSRYGPMTGAYPFRTDVSVWPTTPLIKEGQATVASLLNTEGYRTAMVGKWHLGFEERGYDRPLRGGPSDRGFDTFFGFRASTDIPPYFPYLAPTAPHTPWLPSAEFEGRSPAGMYGDFTMMVDAMVGGVLRALDGARMADETIVIFTSDNGPVWYPEDVARTGHDSVGGLRGMKASNWEGGHRVPFLVRWPGRTKGGSVSAQTISFIDVMATLADVIRVTLPEGAGPDSLSFLPVLLGTQLEDVPVRESPVVGQSIRSGPWKWIDGHEPVAFYRPERGRVPSEGSPPGLPVLGENDETANRAYIRHFVLREDAELEQRYGLRYAKSFHYIGPKESMLEEYIDRNAVPL